MTRVIGLGVDDAAGFGVGKEFICDMRALLRSREGSVGPADTIGSMSPGRMDIEGSIVVDALHAEVGVTGDDVKETGRCGVAVPKAAKSPDSMSGIGTASSV